MTTIPNPKSRSKLHGNDAANSANKTKIVHVRSMKPEDSLSSYVREFIFDIHGFGHQYNSAGNVCDYRIVGDFELIFVIGGQSLITIGQTQYHFQKGDIVLIPPFTRNKISTLQEDPHDNYFIHFDVQPFYRQNEFQNHLSSAISHCTAQEFADILHPLLLQMEYENAENRPGSMLYFELLFHQLIIALLRTDFKESPQAVYGSGPQTDEKKIADKAIDFIQRNLEKPVRIKDICEYLHISESYLHKIFSSQIRLSPNQMILLCKVKRAEQLLKTANYSIKEISEMLCFSSQYYFSTVFKRFYGISPRDFQNLL